MNPKTFALLSFFVLAACGPAMEDTQTAVPDTPFAVGSQTIFIHDDSRPYDSVAGVNSGIRTLVTEVWYPVDHSDMDGTLRRATYGDYVFGNREMHRLMMTNTTFFHLTADTVNEGVTQDHIDAALDELFSREPTS